MKFMVLILLLFAPGAHFQEKRYYWQDYTGEIPNNALEGGYDANGDSIFVGQATNSKNETLPVTLYRNSTFVFVTVLNTRDIEIVNSSIKILCGEKFFSWVQVNFDDLQVKLIETNPIIGGNYGEDGIVYIGRVFYKNEIGIGAVLASPIGHADFYFARNGRSYDSAVFEVMVFQRAGRKKRPPFRRGHPKRHN